MPAHERLLPLCVDLDGTLARVNTIWEQMVALLRKKPWMVVPLVGALSKGIPAFKRRLAHLSPIDQIALPFQTELVRYLEGESNKGREIMLVTAADQSTATHVAALFPFFAEGVGTSSAVNLAGRAKARFLVERYGEKQFVYAGNEHRDLRVWEHAGAAVVVNASKGLARQAAKLAPVERIFDDRPRRPSTILRLLRPHQWLKNILVFVPVLTAHRWDQPLTVHIAFVAFAAFCLAASGAYVLNDIVDLPSDRAHPTKKNRPFAAGDLPLEWGLFLAPTLLLASGLLSLVLPASARLLLASYVLLTLLYSFVLKRVLLLDVLVLATLYALRLVMGHLATGIPTSTWLTAFALCMFLSLALLKRYSELHGRESGYAPGRGYHVDHRTVVASAGIVSGVVASILIVFYAQSAHVRTLYAYPAALYALCPLFLLWIGRMWRLGLHGRMNEDPVLFTLHDVFSIAIGGATVVLMFLAQ